MAQIEITENKYNTICDTYGCSNIAKFVVGKVGEGQAQKVLYCEECLQGIINAAPIDMILARPELAEIEEEFIPEDSEGKCEDTTKCSNPDNVGKAQEVETADLSLMKFNELKELAASKGLTVPFGCSKEQLIELITKEG